MAVEEKLELINQQFKKWLNNSKTNSNPIPHIIHHIWIGKKLPSQYKPFIDSFKKFNPDWKFILWDEKKILALETFQNRKAFLNSPNVGSKSDIARYEILNQFGGFYFDTDFECIKPLDDLAQKSSFVSTLQLIDKVEFGNAMLGCIPHHPIIEKLNSNIKELHSRDIIEVINTTGPGYLTKIILDNFSLLTNHDAILPCEYFFPVPNTESGNIITSKEKYLTPNSYGVHYWEMSWFDKNIFRRAFRKLKRILLK